MKWLSHVVFAVLLVWFTSGCESTVDTSTDDGGGSSTTPTGSDQSSTTTGTGGPSDAAFAGVTVMNSRADVSGWAQTATLNASVGGGSVNLNYDKARVWPGIDNVNANAWVFFTYKGGNYASTFDYMRPGQTRKSANFQIPMDGGTWRPSSGETVGFMVSGLCRDSRRNVSERSNVDFVTWP